MRIVLHAGFHKTGTTAVQQFLRDNRAALRRHLRLFTKAGQEPLCEAARAFSLTQDPVERAVLAAEWGRFLAAQGPDDPRPVLMSAEDLAGHMPGRHGLTRYAAAPAILAMLADLLQEGIELTVALSLRANGPWRRSCWGQHVRATAHTGSLDEYLAGPGCDLADDAQAVTAAVQGRARVVTSWLEDLAGQRFGPGAPLLALVDLPGRVLDRLTPPPRAKASLPDAVLAQLLALNRAGLDRPALVAAKRAVIDAAQAAG